ARCATSPGAHPNTPPPIRWEQQCLWQHRCCTANDRLLLRQNRSPAMTPDSNQWPPPITLLPFVAAAVAAGCGDSSTTTDAGFVPEWINPPGCAANWWCG